MKKLNVYIIKYAESKWNELKRTHGSFIDYFFEYIEKKDKSNINIKRAGLNHIQYENGIWKIISLNDVIHLENGDL